MTYARQGLRASSYAVTKSWIIPPVTKCIQKQREESSSAYGSGNVDGRWRWIESNSVVHDSKIAVKMWANQYLAIPEGGRKLR